ncbi:hypothetical protein DE146DRAFT_119160 [Phaeosphaeria sp. MPI-PUGE-AT-0046c]|nr:hypothetical protein DE146DRAFT_119160 [Phaeosphaeria sp. MPI-PUGE-AT-0046c]
MELVWTEYIGVIVGQGNCGVSRRTDGGTWWLIPALGFCNAQIWQSKRVGMLRRQIARGVKNSQLRRGRLLHSVGRHHSAETFRSRRVYGASLLVMSHNDDTASTRRVLQISCACEPKVARMKCRCWQRLMILPRLDPHIFGRGCSFCREPSVLRGAISGLYRGSGPAQGKPEERHQSPCPNVRPVIRQQVACPVPRCARWPIPSGFVTRLRRT